MQQKKIVILESNHDTAQAVAESLRGEGFEVCGESDDGSEGVELIERTKPDVVLIGLVLKGLDGFGVMDALRERKIPARAIVTGTFADDEIVARVMAKGARYYLMKPLSPPVVAARAKELAADAGKAAPAPARARKAQPRFAGRKDQRDLYFHRHSAAHQGVRVSARGDQDGGRGAFHHQQCDQTALSEDRRKNSTRRRARSNARSATASRSRGTASASTRSTPCSACASISVRTSRPTANLSRSSRTNSFWKGWSAIERPRLAAKNCAACLFLKYLLTS